jgi:hypothetical protein
MFSFYPFEMHIIILEIAIPLTGDSMLGKNVINEDILPMLKI